MLSQYGYYKVNIMDEGFSISVGGCVKGWTVIINMPERDKLRKDGRQLRDKNQIAILDWKAEWKSPEEKKVTFVG